MELVRRVEIVGGELRFFENDFQIYEYALGKPESKRDGIPVYAWWDNHLSKKTWFDEKLRDDTRKLVREYFGAGFLEKYIPAQLWSLPYREDVSFILDEMQQRMEESEGKKKEIYKRIIKLLEEYI